MTEGAELKREDDELLLHSSRSRSRSRSVSCLYCLPATQSTAVYHSPTYSHSFKSTTDHAVLRDVLKELCCRYIYSYDAFYVKHRLYRSLPATILSHSQCHHHHAILQQPARQPSQWYTRRHNRQARVQARRPPSAACRPRPHSLSLLPSKHYFAQLRR